MGLFRIVFLVVVGCAKSEPPEESACVGLCEILVDDCAVKSFPSTEECQSACAVGEESGANIDVFSSCLESIDDCDTFEIVECENAHGW